jgi:hypothetical protein
MERLLQYMAGEQYSTSGGEAEIVVDTLWYCGCDAHVCEAEGCTELLRGTTSSDL